MKVKLDSEVKRLKTKVNIQVDALIQKDKEIELLKKQIESLETANLKLKEEQGSASKQVEVKIDSAAAELMNQELYNFFNKFCELVRKIHENGKFIPYKNVTKYSNNFCKVERNTFEGYVNEIAGDTAPDFIKNCMDFLCIKSEAGKCVFNNDKLRIYFLNRKLVDAILSEVAEAASDNEAPGEKVV